jgi:hypothetical protein
MANMSFGRRVPRPAPGTLIRGAPTTSRGSARANHTRNRSRPHSEPRRAWTVLGVLSGEHKFAGAGNLRVDWRGASGSAADEPDRRKWYESTAG